MCRFFYLANKCIFAADLDTYIENSNIKPNHIVELTMILQLKYAHVNPCNRSI